MLSKGTTLRTFALLCAAMVAFSYYFKYHLPPKWSLSNFMFGQVEQLDDDIEVAIASNLSCSLSLLNPWDKRITAYIGKTMTYNCSKSRQPDIVAYDAQKRAFVVKDPIAYKCAARCVLKSVSDSIVYGPFENITTSTAHLNVSVCDVTHIQCRNVSTNQIVYDLNHAHIVADAQLKAHWRTRSPAEGAAPPPSIFMLVIDATSRSNLVRQMPRTFHYVTHELRAIDFRHHHKVGINSAPNAYPMLTGFSNVELEARTNALRTDCDEWPIVWRNLSARRYATLFADDWPGWSIFAYNVKGFRRQPTTHYLRPFNIAMEASAVFRNSSPFCYGQNAKHVQHLNYCGEFLDAYGGDGGVPLFALCWLCDFTHQRIHTASLADDDFVAFLEAHRAALERSFLFFIGDHGNNLDPIVRTRVGRAESSLPFFLFAPPRDFGARHAPLLAQARANADRLTSQFDIHATIAHILRLDGHDLPDEHDGRRFGQSLFTPVSPRRSCFAAGIPSLFCQCANAQELPIGAHLAQLAAMLVLQRINDMLKEVGDLCAPLELDRVDRASFTNASGGDGLRVFVSFFSKPGGGLFDGSIVHDAADGRGQYRIENEIVRIDTYGQQSRCITHQVLRMFCYCQPATTTTKAKVMTSSMARTTTTTKATTRTSLGRSSSGASTGA